MTTFKRQRSLQELIVKCKEYRWKLDTQKYDKEGSDFVGITFEADRVRGHILVSMVNGRFFGTFDGTQFSSDESNLDNEAWFKMLLETVYL
jgi:hypothetical protein